MSLTPEEKQKRKEERKVKRALKIARLRSLKNFGWWLFGLISSVFITIGIIALCVFVVPINTVTGNSTDRYVKEEISSKTIYGAVMAFSEGNYTADQVLYIDNIIDDVQDENVKSLLKTLVNDEVRNTPLTSGGASVVDAIMKNAQNLEVVSTLRLFTNEPIVDDIEGILGNATIGSLTNGTFDFNGVKLSAIASIANINLDELKIGDQGLLDLVYETVSNDSEITEKPASKEDITIGNLTTLKVEKLPERIPLDTFIKETPDNSTIYSILRVLADKEGGEEIFIGDLFSVTNERVNAIQIFSIVDLDENVKAMLYAALDDSKYTSENPKPASKDDITIGDLKNVNKDIIKLNDVATLDPAVLDMLYAALDASKYTSENPKPANKDEITVGDLKNLNINGVKLGSVIPKNTENANLYAILDGVFGGNAEDKTISDLSSFNINNITLGTVFKKSENVEMYKILDEVLGGDAENKKIADLSGFNIGNIKIGTVIPNNADNAEIYKLLTEAFADAENTKLSELSTFNVNKVKVGTVLARSENEKFYNVLDEVFGADSHNKKLEELNDFDLTRIHLSIALDVPTAENSYKNKTIYDVLLQATGKTSYSEITLSDLSGSFDINSVKLSTIMSKGENKTVNALLDSDATVGNIGEKLNSLSIYDIYGTDCFTKTPHGTQRFTLTTEAGKHVYTLSPTGEYYISENAGIWLLICFDSEKNASGEIVKYTEANVTLNDLSNNNVIKDKFTSATVRQLIAAGIVADPGFSNSDYYDHTLIEILGIIKDLP